LLVALTDVIAFEFFEVYAFLKTDLCQFQFFPFVCLVEMTITAMILNGALFRR